MRRLAAVVAGEEILALAHGEPEMGFARQPVRTTARVHGGATLPDGRYAEAAREVDVAG